MSSFWNALSDACQKHKAKRKLEVIDFIATNYLQLFDLSYCLLVYFVHFYFDAPLSHWFPLFLVLLDVVLYLCEREHVEGGMIFQLLEDLTEMSTMRNCKDIFGYIESKQDILGKVCPFYQYLRLQLNPLALVLHFLPWLMLVFIFNCCVSYSKNFLLVENLWCWERVTNFFVVFQRYLSGLTNTIHRYAYSFLFRFIGRLSGCTLISCLLIFAKLPVNYLDKITFKEWYCGVMHCSSNISNLYHLWESLMYSLPVEFKGRTCFDSPIYFGGRKFLIMIFSNFESNIGLLMHLQPNQPFY